MVARQFSGDARGRSLRVRGGMTNPRVTLVFVALILGALAIMTIVRGQRVAAWAPLDVVSSRDPLQELPIRTAGNDGVVRPAHTYDAVLDMTRLSSLVVGVDLDVIPRGSPHYDAVIRDSSGSEIFRDGISPRYFSDGRFMLRLYSRRLHAGDYLLEIEAGEGDSAEARVVGASWFQVLG
jgi:hypothetical protein